MSDTPIEYKLVNVNETRGYSHLCPICGALVLEPGDHNKWHEDQEKRWAWFNSLISGANPLPTPTKTAICPYCGRNITVVVTVRGHFNKEIFASHYTEADHMRYTCAGSEKEVERYGLKFE